MTKMEEMTEDFQRAYINNTLAKCTEAQQAFFRKIWPNEVPKDKLVTAAGLIERTIKKNEQKEE